MPAGVVGYVRVSTDEQELSPAAQRLAIERWAAGAGLRVVEVVEDIGVKSWSALDSRPGMRRALELLEAPESVALVAAATDRFARVPELLSELRRRVGALGARCVGLDSPELDGSGSPESAFMRHVLDGLPYFHLLKIKGETRRALAARKQAGKCVGSIPYGLRLSDADQGRRARGKRSIDPLVEVPEEQAAIIRARELRARGLGYKSIAKRLADEGYPHRGARWYATSVRRMLASDR